MDNLIGFWCFILGPRYNRSSRSYDISRITKLHMQSMKNIETQQQQYWQAMEAWENTTSAQIDVKYSRDS